MAGCTHVWTHPCAEQHDEWVVVRRYMSAESLAKARLEVIDGEPLEETWKLETRPYDRRRGRGGEALDMLQAMNTGHDGSLSTAQANLPGRTPRPGPVTSVEP